MIGKSCSKCPVKNEAPTVCKKVQEWVDGYTTECPVQWVNEYSVVFQAYNYSDKGIMPNSGGWSEQPAKLMRFVDLVSAERAKQDGN